MRHSLFLILFLISICFANSAFAVSSISNIAEVRKHVAKESAVQEDFKRILHEASLPEDLITFIRNKNQPSFQNSTVTIHSRSEGSRTKYVLEVAAPDTEWVFAAYYGLHKMGFMFPHPRIQISPTESRIAQAAGRTYVWQPRFQYRGFHFHTMHASEFLQGFLMGKKEIGRESIRWLARNGQNVGQVVLLEQKFKQLVANLSDLVDYSHDMGVSFGVNAFFNFMQQNAYRVIGTNNKLVSLGLIPGDKRGNIRRNIKKLTDKIAFDFMTFDIGSSEFTPASYDKTIDWINTADEELKTTGRRVFIKVHCSEGQHDEKYGNFNFVPQYTNKTVGVLPHTVMFYGLTDKYAPVYGRKDFNDITEFLHKQAPLRPTWYYPETSYYIAMDIDLPVLLTDYLIVRSKDMDLVEKAGVQGHLNFTTGQELGYWLKDWTVALLANSEYRYNPMIALDLLGESRKVWEPILAFQNRFFKHLQLIEEITSANLLDDLDLGMITHERTLLKDLRKQPLVLGIRINVLKEALANLPPIDEVKNDELKAMLQITHWRLQHAYHLREALLLESQNLRKTPQWWTEMNHAKTLRLNGQVMMKAYRAWYERYPEALLFDRMENLSSYPFGYAFTAGKLHFWEREEAMIHSRNYNWWYKNLFSIGRIIL